MIKVRHLESKDFVKPINKYNLHIKFEVISGKLNEVYLVYWKRFNESSTMTIRMRNFSLDNTSPYYETVVCSQENIRYLNYYFLIKTADETLYYTRNHVSKVLPNVFFEYQFINQSDFLDTPIWAEGRIGYQIFLDRFYRSEDREESSKYELWTEKPNRTNVFGGDIQGLIAKLPYLKDLGVSIIILMPLFKAHSNHKYDTIDYFVIDPNYGSIEDLLEFVEKSHEIGISVILDGVFNHIGYYSDIFQNVLRLREKSKYYQWFHILNNQEELEYISVGDYKWMPKLNYTSKEVQDYIIGVAKHWISIANIDGWRLDVFDELDEMFRYKLTRELKADKPDVLIIGETWHDGSDYLNNNQADSVMNYLYRKNVLDFFIESKISSHEFKSNYEWLMFRYPKYTRNVLYNLLGSHDTTRIMTLAKNNLEKVKLAYAFLLLTPGIPVIYYGDEIGLTGENDPLCRGTMNWDIKRSSLRDQIKELAQLRNESLALRLGDLSHVYIHDDIYSFIRKYESEEYLILFNNTDKDVLIYLDQVHLLKNQEIDHILVKKTDYKVIKICE